MHCGCIKRGDVTITVIGAFTDIDMYCTTKFTAEDVFRFPKGRISPTGGEPKKWMIGRNPNQTFCTELAPPPSQIKIRDFDQRFCMSRVCT